MRKALTAGATASNGKSSRGPAATPPLLPAGVASRCPGSTATLSDLTITTTAATSSSTITIATAATAATTSTTTTTATITTTTTTTTATAAAATTATTTASGWFPLFLLVGGGRRRGWSVRGQQFVVREVDCGVVLVAAFRPPPPAW